MQVAPIGSVIIDNEYGQAVELGSSRWHLPVCGAALAAEVGRKVKGATLADDALHPQPSPHQFDQLLGDGQSQPGTAILARGGPIGLGERLEDQPLLGLRNANTGIADGYMQGNSRVVSLV